MWKYTVHVNGMMCKKCENNVNDAVRKTFSVKEVISSYTKNETTEIAENKMHENVLRHVILFCRQGGVLLEFVNGQKPEVKAGQVLFFPGRIGGCRCHFLQEPFQGILVSEDENSALASFCTI